MNKQIIKDSLGWGILLWFMGYALGIVFFFFVPVWLIGWLITPIGIVITFLVLWKKINGASIKYFLMISLVWTMIAIVFDYIFLVKLFKPADGYYKLDVYLYYAMTLILPLLVGWRKIAIKNVKK